MRGTPDDVAERREELEQEGGRVGFGLGRERVHDVTHDPDVRGSGQGRQPRRLYQRGQVHGFIVVVESRRLWVGPQTGPIGQPGQRASKVHAAELRDEAKHVASGLAGVAAPHLLVSINAQRWAAVVVEGATRQQLTAAVPREWLACQSRNDVLEAIRRADGLLIGEAHRAAASLNVAA